MNIQREKEIEQFFLLFKRSRSFLIENSSGFSNINRKKEFIDRLMMQLFVLWCLQERGFFNDDKSYFITKFNEIQNGKTPNGFNNYYSFLKYFLQKAKLSTPLGYFEDKHIGKIVSINPAIFINFDSDSKDFTVPDSCFYILNKKKGSMKKPDSIIPFLNLLESQKWSENILNEFVLGAIYEKIMTRTIKKGSGVYYTPEEVTSYTCRTAIESYLIEKINRTFNSRFNSLDEIFSFPEKRMISYLYENLRLLKILDPAVGVGHFLVTTIKFLLEIYINVWKISKDLNFDEIMKFKFLDDNGNQILLNLLDVNDINQVKLFIITYIILPKNIYGVDINNEAVQIARARLYVFMTKFMNRDNTSIIRLQDVFFNLKIGNSLLGYIQLDYTTNSKQLKLERYLTLKEESPCRTFFINHSLADYILQAGFSLNIKTDLSKRMEELDLIFNQEEVNQNDIKKVLRLTYLLLQVLLHSSGSKFKNNLQNLLFEITRSLSTKLDKEFSNQFNITLDQLKILKTFHWLCEFPSVFIENGGFDIVVANPPYLGESGNKELFRIFSCVFPRYYEGKMDLWYLFLHRSLDLMIQGAYSSFISSNYWITATGAMKLRTRILNDTFLVEYINFNENKVFSNAPGIHTNIITFKKSNFPNDFIKCTHFNNTYPQGTDLFGILDKQLCFKADQKKLTFRSWDNYFHFLPTEVRVIIEFIIDNSEMMKNKGFYVKEGIITGLNSITERLIKKYGLKNELKGEGVFILDEKNLKDLKVIESFSKGEKYHLKPFYKSSDINRFSTNIHTTKRILYLDRNNVDLESLPNVKSHLNRFIDVLKRSLDNPPFINRPRSEKIFISPKIVTPQRSLQNTFGYISNDWFAAQDVYYILNGENNIQKLKTLLLILNSKLAYFWLNWMGKKKGKHLELFGEPLGYFPVPPDIEQFMPISVITDYLLFLNSMENVDSTILSVKDFFEKEIADSLVLEFYFMEKLYENGLYSSKKYFLLDSVLKNLKHIEYENWAKLNYIEIMGNKLNQREGLMKSAMTADFLKIIEKTYISLNNDQQINKLIEKIKSHSWVKRIILE
ncbi:MAG: Eco57I restriction-modification methylase domain-containing protein [Candidatus Hodarchaeota archaeon]